MIAPGGRSEHVHKPGVLGVVGLGLVLACGRALVPSGLFAGEDAPRPALERERTRAGPPASALAVRYPVYANRSVYTVSWRDETGHGVFELEERVGRGEWRRLYRGSGLSVQVSGRASGLYAYRVRSCSHVGCGAFVTGPALTVDLPRSARVARRPRPASRSEGTQGLRAKQ
jgi:hypothetical protein